MYPKSGGRAICGLSGKATLRENVRASLPEGPFTLPARA
jgi:hypothetical protein